MKEPLSSSFLAKFCAEVLDKAKMEDIKIFDVSSALQIADCFVLASGRNVRHIKAASSELFKELREHGISRRGLEGHRGTKWLLVDLSDVVVHLFLPETRQFYDLESLWGDCPRVAWEAPVAVALDR